MVGHAEALEEALERRAGRERQIVTAETRIGRPLHLDPHRNHRGLDLFHDVGEADGLLRKLLSLLRQVLRMRRAHEKVSLGRSVRCKKSSGAKTGDGCRQQCHAPRRQIAA